MISIFSPVAHADRFDNRIQNLKQKNVTAAQNRDRLGRDAANLATTIAALRAEVAELEGQIQQTQGKVTVLQQNIAGKEAELTEQRQLLGENLRKMYTDQDMSTLEMLASSHNLSHYLDQEQYRQSLQAKIDSTVKHIETLMVELRQQKQAADQLLDDQREMQKRIDSQRAESNRLLGLNQSEQRAYQQQMNANSVQLAKLEKEQAALNVKGFVNKPSPKPSPIKLISAPVAAKAAAPSGAKYPYDNVPFPNELPDPWGMYKRQCVSYTAWKVADSGRHMPYWGGRGNAKQWDDNARKAGIPVDSTPRVGDVAVSNAGTYGHVMYVEAVHGDGTVTVSQYNARWDGAYSEGRKSTSGLVFIHF